MKNAANILFALSVPILYDCCEVGDAARVVWRKEIKSISDLRFGNVTIPRTRLPKTPSLNVSTPIQN